jgi:hypothetical protein
MPDGRGHNANSGIGKRDWAVEEEDEDGKDADRFEDSIAAADYRP